MKLEALDIETPIPPGETMTAELQARGMSTQDLAKGIGLSIANTEALLRGDEILDEDIAVRLAEFFGTSAGLWKNLEKQFRETQRSKTSAQPSGKIALRLPKSLHERVLHLAELEGVSMNHCLISIVSEGVTRHELRS